MCRAFGPRWLRGGGQVRSNSASADTVPANVRGVGGTALTAQDDVADEAAMARVFDTPENEIRWPGRRYVS
jgi:hypothetical protein